MGLRLNKQAYKSLLEEDLIWLNAQKCTLEREHIRLLIEHEIKTFAIYDSIPDTGDRA